MVTEIPRGTVIGRRIGGQPTDEAVAVGGALLAFRASGHYQANSTRVMSSPVSASSTTNEMARAIHFCRSVTVK